MMRPYLLIAILFFTICSFSQTTISGKIVGEKNIPIPNANVYLDKTYDGATSDKNGECVYW